MILGMALNVSAAENEVGSLWGCEIEISCLSDGVGISYATRTTTDADIIVLEEYVNGSWEAINAGGGSTTNASYYGGSKVYTGAVEGRKYRAHCTHFATWGSTTKTLYNDTREMIYNKP